MSKRAAPPPSQWKHLGDEFRQLASGTGLSPLDSLGRLEMRAAKLHATCLEHGVIPSEYRLGEDAKSLRERIEEDDRKRGLAVESISDILLGDIGLRIGPPPKPLPRFGAHGMADLIWHLVAFKFLPERFPDCFDGPSLREAIALPFDQSEASMLRWFRQKARVQAVACSLLADLCHPAKSDDDANDADGGDADSYKPANYFDPKVAGRLRHAASGHRKGKQVRCKTEDGTKLYHVGDARRWWPHDVPNA